MAATKYCKNVLHCKNKLTFLEQFTKSWPNAKIAFLVIEVSTKKNLHSHKLCTHTLHFSTKILLQVIIVLQIEAHIAHVLRFIRGFSF
jgi:hypothetical protein